MNLEAALRARLAPVLLRRTRVNIALDLPTHTTEIVRITPTDEKLGLHNAHLSEAATLAERRTRVSESAGQLLTAAFTLLGDLLPKPAAPDPQTTEALRTSLAQCAETDEAGRQKLTLTLPNANALNTLAEALARLLSSAKAWGSPSHLWCSRAAFGFNDPPPTLQKRRSSPRAESFRARSNL